MPTGGLIINDPGATAAHQYGVVIHGLDVAKQPGQAGGSAYGTNIDSAVITERLGEPCTAEFIVDDPQKALTIERSDDVYIWDGWGRSLSSGARVTDDLFRGYVTDVARIPDGLGWRWRVTARSLEDLLDKRKLTSGVIPAGGTVVAALQQVLSTLDPRVSALNIDTNAITAARGAGGWLIHSVASISAADVMVAAVPLAGKSYRDALRDIVAASSDPQVLAGFDYFATLIFNIDVQGRFRYGRNTASGRWDFLPYGFTADGNNIREGAGAWTTQAAPYDIEAVPDLSGYVSRVFVQGVDAASSGWIIDVGSEARWGRVEDYLVAPTAVSATTRDAAGWAYLQDKRPIYRVTLALSDTHDRLIPNPAPDNNYTGWHVRAYSSITSDSGLWPAIGVTSGVSGVLWEIVKRFDGGGTHMTLELGFGGGRPSPSAAIATAFADMDGDTKAAGRLVGSLNEVAVRVKNGIPSDADFDVPRDGFMVLDTSAPATNWMRVSSVWQPIASAHLRASVTAGVNVTQVLEASADLIVTAPAITCDGVTGIEVRFFAGNWRPDGTVAGRTITLWLFEDGASVGRMAFSLDPAALNDWKPLEASLIRIPTAGSHIYSIRATVSAGTGSVSAGVGGAGNDPAAEVRVRRVSI